MASPLWCATAWAPFEPWLREKPALVSEKSKLAEAIRYALTRWPGLALFLEDGRVVSGVLRPRL